jgi:hypothetical protein
LNNSIKDENDWILKEINNLSFLILLTGMNWKSYKQIQKNCWKYRLFRICFSYFLNVGLIAFQSCSQSCFWIFKNEWMIWKSDEEKFSNSLFQVKAFFNPKNIRITYDLRILNGYANWDAVCFEVNQTMELYGENYTCKEGDV